MSTYGLDCFSFNTHVCVYSMEGGGNRSQGCMFVLHSLIVVFACLSLRVDSLGQPHPERKINVFHNSYLSCGNSSFPATCKQIISYVFPAAGSPELGSCAQRILFLFCLYHHLPNKTIPSVSSNVHLMWPPCSWREMHLFLF